MPNWKDEIRRLLAEGRKIDAIKLYRQETGLGLTEAKDWIERLERGEADFVDRPASAELERQVLELIRAGQKLAAIKLYREGTSLGLKEAKDAVEALAVEHGIAEPARAGCFGVLLLLCGLVLLAVGFSI
ncbi:MAG TPA: ribosomal protein L7/L12 [Pirellulales bacterium]|nr:ribosomal protein L7/L12 [Pirellulales bacterium]